MRKLILMAAMVLVSATAQAGVNRGLTLASNDEPAAARQPKAVDATTQQPKENEAKPIASTRAPRVEKPKHRRELTEARVIYELHRHGIYW